MWNLLFETVTKEFSVGPDNAARNKDMAAIINKYKKAPHKKCLQVGINHPETDKHAPHFICLDKWDKGRYVDVSEDLAHTSFENDVFDFILCRAILEHVTDPFGCSKEMERIAKIGCELWLEVPFAQPFHPIKGWTYSQGYMLDTFGDENLPSDKNHGGDFWRFTPQGIAYMLKGFQPIRFYIAQAGGIAFHGLRKG